MSAATQHLNDTHRKTGRKIIIIDWKTRNAVCIETKSNNNHNTPCTWHDNIDSHFVYHSQRAFIKLSILLRYEKKVFLMLLLLLLRVAADNRATSQMWTPFNQFGSVGFCCCFEIGSTVNTYTITCSMNVALLFFYSHLSTKTICQRKKKRKSFSYKFHQNETNI